ncbi:MAG: hypothetical protein KGL39_53790 [Patescibacteria group bacterium]|nr:hypothetical protein [Patescibacteria group bacterium]
MTPLLAFAVLVLHAFGHPCHHAKLVRVDAVSITVKCQDRTWVVYDGFKTVIVEAK